MLNLLRRFSPRRALVWKDHINTSNAELWERLEALEESAEDLAGRVERLEAEKAWLERCLAKAIEPVAWQFEKRISHLFPQGCDNLCIAAVLRGRDLLVCPQYIHTEPTFIRPCNAPQSLMELSEHGDWAAVHLVGPVAQQMHQDAGLRLYDAMTQDLSAALAWLAYRAPPPKGLTRDQQPVRPLMWEDVPLDLIDFHAKEAATGSKKTAPPPFHDPEALPRWTAARVRRRSVLFSKHCYYNFYYLAKALRARGWDAVCLSTHDPSHSDSRFYHGEDINLFHPDRDEMRAQVTAFFGANADRFGIVHSYGIGTTSLFVENHATDAAFGEVPWDMLELKRRGVLLGYSHSGCLDGVSQSGFRAWSPSMCPNCVWQNQPTVCSNARNVAWGRKVAAMMDLFCTETDPFMEYKASANVFRAPLTFALDTAFWSPELDVPAHLQRSRKSGEIIVYHAMGNYSKRTSDSRNVKGTGAVVNAVEKLRREGLPIRLDFVHDVSSTDNRFVQVQADIIVDQLHYGRYGALAREGMMLGKPVVGRVEKMDGPGLPATQCILDTPIVHADTNTIAEVLRDLCMDSERRQRIGRDSRAHAEYWWSAERLAARFEAVYDHVRDHGCPPAEEEVA